MIAVKLWGGIGNQLFQYAFGKSMAISEKKDLFFYSIPVRDNKSRSPLEVFRINLKRLNDKQLGKFYFFSYDKFSARIERKIISLFPVVNRNVLVEPSLSFQNLKNSRAICYDGYWQSFKYFTSIKDDLLNEIELRDTKDLPESIFTEITKCNSVSVHIRRGDYLSKANEKIYCRCGVNYYQKALSWINKVVSNPVFYIFSNDPSWVKEDYTFLKNFEIRYVEYGLTPSPNVDLILMSKCRHNIIANSTFSWWSAFINKNPQKIVIVPEQWYQRKIRYSVDDLIPQEWIKM
jgi:hypothetical protein